MTSFRIVQFHAVQKEQAVNKTILKGYGAHGLRLPDKWSEPIFV